MVRVVYRVSSKELFFYAIIDPLSILSYVVVVGIMLMIMLASGENLYSLHEWNLVILILALIVGALAWFILPLGWVGYGVEDGYIVIRAEKTYRVPIDKADIALVDYRSVKPLYRIWGIGALNFCLGEVKLANGERGIALVYKPASKAIVIRYGDRVFVISHPGVEEAYRRLVELVSSSRVGD